MTKFTLAPLSLFPSKRDKLRAKRSEQLGRPASRDEKTSRELESPWSFRYGFGFMPPLPAANSEPKHGARLSGNEIII